MKRILIIIAIVLMISVSVSLVSARRFPVIRPIERTAFKAMLKNYFHPVIHGYGIGFTEDTYITAKWHIVNVRILNKEKIRRILTTSNKTDWASLREEIRNTIETEGITVKKGRIRIGKTNYLLTNIEASDNQVTADIYTIPNFTECKQLNMSAEECETSGEKVGSLSLTKKTAMEEIPGEAKVWAGTLEYKEVEYTFVTFAYPRW